MNSKIIEIASNSKHSGLNNKFTHKTSIKNSLCGDKIIVELIANKEKISSMRYEAESCVLCEASASLISKIIKNYSLKNLKKDINVLKSNIKNSKSNYPSRFKDFKYLASKSNVNRSNCVILPLEALLKAFKL